MHCRISLGLVALFATMTATAAMGQQAVTSASAQQAGDNPPPLARIGDLGVTAPELMPVSFPTEQVKHCQKWDGTVVLSAVIDPSGQARDVYLLRPTGDDLDKQALEIVAEDRFKPGSRNGALVAVGVAIQVKMEFCLEPVSTGPNAGAYNSRLRSQPEQAIKPLSSVRDFTVPVSGLKPNHGVMPPVPLYSHNTGPLPGSGECIVSVLVDEHGMPQDLKVVKDTSGGSCRVVSQSELQQRYKPAMKDGEPIAVRIEIDIKSI